MKAGAIVAAARQRFEALSLRERVLTLATAATVAWWCVDQSAGAYGRATREDAAVASRRLSAGIDEQRRALEGILETFRSNPARALRQRIAADRARGDAMREQIMQQSSELAGDTAFNRVLSELLALSGNTRIRRVQTLAPIPAAKVDGETVLWERGVEITFEANWPDCLAYLKALEESPHRLLWNSLDYRLDTWPQATVRIGIATLEVDPGWSG